MLKDLKAEHVHTRKRKSGRIRLRTLVNIRWLAVMGQATALLLVRYGFGFEFDIMIPLALVAMSAMFNFYLHVGQPSTRSLTDMEARLQLLYDLMQLGILLYLTGGMENPFTLLIVVPVAISAMRLSRYSTRNILLFSIVIALVLTVYHEPLPWSDEPILLPDVYVWGLWLSVVISLAFLSAYAAIVSTEARRRSDALTAMRDALANEQKMSALGSLAAATAHELGTPLGTITLAAKELMYDIKDDALREDVQLIHDQAMRCRDILKQMGAAGGAARGDEKHLKDLPIEALVKRAADPYQGGAKTLTLTCDGTGPQPVLSIQEEFIHSVGTFIENAMDFAQTSVNVRVMWNDNLIRVVIEDDGLGFDQGILSKLGEPYVSSRKGGVNRAGKEVEAGGMGLGVFIGVTLVERTGGTVHFSNREDGGARVDIIWTRGDIEGESGE